VTAAPDAAVASPAARGAVRELCGHAVVDVDDIVPDLAGKPVIVRVYADRPE
jgi:hypothetical protein